MFDAPRKRPRLILASGIFVLGILTGTVIFRSLQPTIAQIPFRVSEVRETFRTTAPHGESDSIAIYRDPDGKHDWMFVTDKHGNRLQVFDAATGAFIRDFGSAGTGPGQFNRPNGVAVWQATPGSPASQPYTIKQKGQLYGTAVPPVPPALLFVVERDGKRVQAFTLPDLTHFTTFGVGELTKPYGVAVETHPTGLPLVYITDNSANASTRVRRYSVVQLPMLQFSCEKRIGDSAGAGEVKLVESIAIDPEYSRLYICDEHHRQRNVKAYSTTTGRFLDRTFGDGYITDDPEGIAVWREGKDGWIILTNQGKSLSTFHFFDRATLEHVGAFVGHTRVANTDGIAITQGTLGNLIGGAMYALDDDGPVAAFAWQDIVNALKLRVSSPQQFAPAAPTTKPTAASRTADANGTAP